MELISTSPEETKNIAKNFAKKLKPGSLLALFGYLGSGKTTFIQELATLFAIKKRVLSPTFIFIRSYQLKNKGSFTSFHHIDLYRIEKPQELKSLGLEEFINDKNSITAIEWADKLKKLPKKSVKIRFKIIDNERRKIEIKWPQ